MILREYSSKLTSVMKYMMVALSMIVFVGLLTVPAHARASAIHTSDSHSMHSSEHQSFRDCASACGSTIRAEEKASSIERRKKEKEKQPDKPVPYIAVNTFVYKPDKFRTVYIPLNNNDYLRFSTLRL